MKTSLYSIFAFCTFLIFELGSGSIAYGQDEIEPEKLESYKEEVKQMVSFLQFSVNVLGDPTFSAKEKDIIINESYLKIFASNEVQVEDDLIENRDVVTNKDVQAYLKDVDFFFKEVAFQFNILDIAHDLNHEGSLFFTVKMMRNLKGITVENDSVDSDQERYIEINVDEENKDLRIASIYTTKLSRNEELRIWWGGMSLEWKALLGLDIEVKEGLRLNEIQQFSDSSYFADDIFFEDSIRIIDFVKIAASKEEIDLSGSTVITSLKPLDQLKSLKVLDISSSDITDLFPIRNLTTIEILDCSNTKVENLQPLKYSKSLKQLYISNTPVSSITVIEIFENLELLHMERTVIDSLPAVGGLSNLKELNASSTNLESLDSVAYLRSLEILDISNTAAGNLEPLVKLSSLRELNISNTQVKSLEAIKGMKSLESLSMENSPIDDLSPLTQLDNLRHVYADGSAIDLADFVELANAQADVDVVFMTDELRAFWSELDKTWIDLIGTRLNFTDTISSAEIHKILQIRDLDLHGNKVISTIDPLKYMPLLESLDISETAIVNLGPLSGCANLRVLRGRDSQVLNLSPIAGLVNMQVIDFSNSGIGDIRPLSGMKKLDTLIFDDTQVKDIEVLNDVGDFTIAYFNRSRVADEHVAMLNYDEEKSVVVYKTDKLRVWWGNMDDGWQDIFKELDGLSDRPTTEQLHILTSRKKLDVQGTSLKGLDPIPEFERLESLAFSDTRISSLYPLINLSKLKELRCPRNPISDIEAVSALNNLQVLDLESTQIKDIKSVKALKQLKELKFSGTMVKDISPVEGLDELEVLEFSKTRVRSVNALSSLNNLKVLKCYNNKISDKKIEEFRLANPDCEVVFY